MNQLQVANPEFNAWLVNRGYIDENGVLAVSLREAQALWCQQDIEGKKVSIEQSFISIAKSLWLVYREQLWVELGFNNFEEFLCSPEIDISRSVGYSMRQLGQFIEEGIVDEDWALKVGTSKVRTLLPKIREGEDVEEWLAKAEVLTNLDLQDEVAGKEIARYSGTGPLPALIGELQQKNEFWEGEVHLRVKTV